MEQNQQLQEFVERLIVHTFLARYGELFIEDITDDMGITDEMWNLYEQLGERDSDNNGND